MISIRHRDASGPLSSLWDFDPVRHVIMLVHRGIAIDIPVSLETNPRHNSYSLSRKGGDTWQLCPCRYVQHRNTWTAIPMPFDPEGTLAEFVALTCANDRVNAELEAL